MEACVLYYLGTLKQNEQSWLLGFLEAKITSDEYEE